MAIFILVLCFIIGLVFLYALVIRPWLRTKPWAQSFFELVEPVEIALFKKSETILVGRLIWVGSAIVTLYDSFAISAQSLDLTPLTTRLFDLLHIPPDLRSIITTALLAALGLVINLLRDRTTKPLELVAVKEADAPAEVKVAMAAADDAKDQAVAAVAEAKAA